MGRGKRFWRILKIVELLIDVLRKIFNKNRKQNGKDNNET